MSPRPKHALGLDLALLGFLQHRSMHAYEMHRELSSPFALGLVWRLKQGHLYMILNRLHDAGYLVSESIEQEKRPNRKQMELTPAGRDAFRAWLQAPVAGGRYLRQEFLVKLYFARQEGDAVVTHLIARQRETLLQTKEEMQERARQAAPDSYAALVYQFRIGQLNASLAWLDQCAGARRTDPPIPA